MLRQALLELEEEWPELKQFGDQFRTAEEIAAVDARIAARTARDGTQQPTVIGDPDFPASPAKLDL
jgi:hypothetical protein